MKTHTETTFETLIVEHLVEHGGYTLGSPDDYDLDRALMPDDLFGFIAQTQPKVWGRLEELHGDKLNDVFLSAWTKAVKQRGVLDVLRHGLKFYGKLVKVAVFAPAHWLNPDVQAQYDANRLVVVRQLRFDPAAPGLEIDLALFVNGIPVVTAELKNPMTGQTVSHAKHQYRADRSPDAPLFRFKRGALVHFAVDTDLVEMTTRLRKDKTFFLPFNRGNGTAAGNPPIAGKHRTAYLWEQVWQRDSLLDILGRFMHLQVEEKTDTSGKTRRSETIIFPRYHQLDAVRELISAARESGPGRNYLVQHSAGSGKSNSIAWLAHRLSSLHDADNQRVYDAVIVLTDRRVLDRQLQDTIYQFDHKAGVVEKIDKHSSQLAEALTSGTPIIISTIHKFGFIQDKIEHLPDRAYAIIVDEAHSSQSGEMAVNVKEILSNSALAQRLKEEGEDLSTPDQLALRAALFRGPQPNMSFFAFTATPKYKTLELFGHRGPDGRPAPFHLYSMRQAIEEGFILDVLQGYTTYKTYFKLIKAIEDDPELDKKKASRALARFMSLHPHNIAQKTEVIVEHFRRSTQHKIGGKAKAMVVTGSRLHAVRYKLAFDKYIAEKGYQDVRALVAFSGEVVDKDVPGDPTYTEVGMNNVTADRDGLQRFRSEGELPERFASDDFQVLLVANKYQTGFDEPRLHTMYVDKRLHGIQAVQTLSRLNRTCPGKEDTFVLDFVNEREEILASFQDYYEAAHVDETVDPQRLYELQTELDAAQLYLQPEVDRFAAVFFKPTGGKKVQDHARLNALIDPAVDRFKHADEEVRETFRGQLSAFTKLYAFLAQIVPFADSDLEKLYVYGRLLLTKLPKVGEATPPIRLGDDVALHSYRLQCIADGPLNLAADGGGALYGPSETGTGRPKQETEHLSKLIEVVNDRFGTEFTEADQLFFDSVEEHLAQEGALEEAAKANTKADFGIKARQVLQEAFVDRHQSNGSIVERFFSDESFKAAVEEWFVARLYERLRGEHPPMSKT